MTVPVDTVLHPRPDAKPTVFEAWSRVMGDIQAIEKNDRNETQNFAFRGIDAVLDAVGPVLRAHGVIVIPRAVSIESERYPSKSGGMMRNATVTMEYQVFGPAGDTFTGSAFGEAADSSDKAVSKAQSVAYRTYLLQGLTIPTRQPDPDAYSHERSAVSPEADEARAELREVCTSLNIDPYDAVSEYAARFGGGDLRTALDPGPIRVLAEHYRIQHAEEVARRAAEKPDAALDLDITPPQTDEEPHP
ncbi:ERF family protein [Nocardia fluminea]|uniref:ERF family protein n=1 Tax=Nocardia fluminea TaxID=134984 RepID=UPI00364FE07C